MRKRIAYFLSHPIQYQTPLIQKLDKESSIDLEVIYLTGHTLNAPDAQFGRKVKWDIPMLDGYKYRFLKNNSPKPAVSGSFWGLINWGIPLYLLGKRPSIVVVHGWGYFSNYLIFFFSKLIGAKVLMRAESPYNQEKNKKGLNRVIKYAILHFFCDAYLYIGEENRLFYKSFKLKDEKLFFTPYCVDNDRFIEDRKKDILPSEDIKALFQIPVDHRVGLFCGKLIHKKNPIDILRALKEYQLSGISIVYVGTGDLMQKMIDYVKQSNLKNIYFAGFVNQTELYRYYQRSDFFILPSGYGETWGLVVNEAMNFKLPLIVSSTVGCCKDLVRGENGRTYSEGNIEELAACMNEYAKMSEEKLKVMGEYSGQIVKGYSIQKAVIGIMDAIG